MSIFKDLIDLVQSSIAPAFLKPQKVSCHILFNNFKKRNIYNIDFRQSRGLQLQENQDSYHTKAD